MADIKACQNNDSQTANTFLTYVTKVEQTAQTVQAEAAQLNLLTVHSNILLPLN